MPRYSKQGVKQAKGYVHKNGPKRRRNNINRVKAYKARKKETPEQYLKRIGIAEHKEVKRITRLLLDRYGAKCAICGKDIRNKKDLTLDHIKPLSKGGMTTLENCQLACLECNQKKADRYDPPS